MVHDLADLLRRHFGERTPQHGEVLRVCEHLPAVDKAAAGDHGVAGEPLAVQPQVGCAVHRKGVDLCERPGVEQLFEPFAGGQLSALALGIDSPLSTPKLRFSPARP